MSHSAQGLADAQERLAEVTRQIAQAFERVEVSIKAGAGEEQLLAGLALVRELVQTHWMLLGVVDASKSPAAAKRST
jgi:hypothetical protein